MTARERDNRCFEFDHVLGPDARQEEVFELAMQPLLCKWFEGIK